MKKKNDKKNKAQAAKKNKVVKPKKKSSPSVKKTKPAPAKKTKPVAPKKVKPAVKKEEKASKDKKVATKKVAADKSVKNREEIKPQPLIHEETNVQNPDKRPLTEQEKKIKALMLKKNKKADDSPRIKLRIDSRTIITVKSKEALRMWKEKYPNAVEED